MSVFRIKFFRSIGLDQSDEHFIPWDDLVCDETKTDTIGFNDCSVKATEEWLNCSLPWGSNSST